MTSPESSPTASPADPSWSRRLLSAAVVALVVGLWMVLGAAGLPVPDMKSHWPVIVLLGGIASLADFALVSRRVASVTIGAGAIALGCFFYTFSAGTQQFRQIGQWWPWLPAILAVALLAGWIAGRAASLPLFASGAIATGIALSGWGAGRWPVQLIWGGVLVAIGIVFLWRILTRSD